MKKNVILGALLSIFFLWLAFRHARFEEVSRALRGARYDLLLLTFVPTMASFALRAARWRILLEAVKPIPFLPLFRSTMIGFMGNNLFPARLGEVLRAYSIGRSANVSRSAAFGSIVVERIFDIAVLLLLFGIVLETHRAPEVVRIWGRMLLFATAPVFGGLLLLYLRGEAVLAWLERRLPQRFGERGVHIARNFRDGLSVFGRPGALLRAAFVSLAMWGGLIVVVHLCFGCLEPVGLRVPPAAALVAVVTMAIGTMIPSAPGFVGTLQYSGTVALLPYGVDPSLALSFTVLYHVSQWIPTTLVGMGYFFQEHLSLRDLSAISPSGSARGGPIPQEPAAPPLVGVRDGSKGDEV